MTKTFSLSSALLLLISITATVFAETNQTKSSATDGGTTITHGMAIHGTAKYPADFTHFEYANPKAPKKGSVKFGAIGTFDSFNPFISKGDPAPGVNLIFDTLTTSSQDEPFSQYGLLAEKIEYPADRSWIRFHLNPKAKFSDGTPVTAEDVVFSFNMLIEKGAPQFQFYYQDVSKVTAEGERTVKFEFANTTNKELPLIIGQIAIFPKHYWKNVDFSKATLDIPIASGPYKIKNFEPGKFVTYELNDNYWGKDIPVNKGRYNFKTVHYDLYRDNVVIVEAFKSGQFDFRVENNSKSWATAYEGPKFDDGSIVKEEIPNERTTGMQGFAFNLRKPIFQDKVLREAMNYAFDFEWSNRTLFYNQYTRTDSYFDNSELAAEGLPTPAELKILNPYKDQLPAEVFTKPYKNPTTDGSGNIRKNLRTAKQMLEKAGYSIKDNVLVNPKGEPIEFEFLMTESGFERIVLPFIKNLSKLGIKVTPRKVEITQYIERMRNFNFDMVVASFGQSQSPGNEQRNFWQSSAADRYDSNNYMGIKNPVVDALVEQLITADDRQDLVNHVRALDRVLLAGHYLIPNWHVSFDRVAYESFLKHPKNTPKYGLDIFTWWVE